MRRYLSILLFLFLASGAYAQSAEVITNILESENVTFGQVCYLSAVHQELVSDNASYSDAIEALYKKGQIPTVGYESSVVPMVNLTFLYSQMWDIKGGIFYRIFHGAPRYAFKQMKADGVLPANADPGIIVSGREALNIYTACQLKYGEAQFTEE